MRRTVMKRKWTPEERRSWREAREARVRELRGLIERAKAELEAKKKPA
jgi:hypothetical protein